MSEDIHTTYSECFRAFRDASNEKPILAGAVIEHAALTPQDSVLDIGAGDGTLVGLIRSNVDSYTALEANGVFCNSLRTQDIEVIEGVYPDSDEQLGDHRFDLVLSSYSTPLELPSATLFLDKAQRRRTATGKLTLVTIGQNGPWSDMMDEVESVLPHSVLVDMGSSKEEVQDFLNRLEEECKGFGYTRKYQINSEVRCGSSDDLFTATAFLATAGLKGALERYYESKKMILPILKKHAPANIMRQTHTVLVVNNRKEVS